MSVKFQFGATLDRKSNMDPYFEIRDIEDVDDPISLGKGSDESGVK